MIRLALLAAVAFCNASAKSDAHFSDAATYPVTDFGAVADDGEPDTAAINEAIRAAHEADGGRVVLGPGAWESGRIVLRSGVTLDVQEGATLRFSDDPADYPAEEVRWEGVEIMGISPLIFARGATDIAIVGSGTIDGSGEWWWAQHERGWGSDEPVTDLERKYAELNADRPHRGRGWMLPRPTLVGIYQSEDVLLEDVTFRDSPFWTVHTVYCDGVTVRGVTVLAPYESPNTDGIDIDSTRNVLIEDSTFDTGDDCIAIKSGWNEDGRRVNRPSEDIIIRRCTFRNGRGGVVIGSETAGSVRRVLAEDCTFDGTLRGLRIKSARGRGGAIEAITLRRATMTDIPDAAINIDMFYGGGSPEPQPIGAWTPTCRDITVQDVTIDGAVNGVAIRGLPERPIEGLELLRVRIGASEKPFEMEHVTGVALDGVDVVARNANDARD